MEVSMKMVKSLLLGSAAGLMAVAGASAAELPVKAAPVEYVKICSLYGAGFYYLPGTDICVKIGGFVRGQYYVNGSSTSPSIMPLFSGPGRNQHTRQEDNTNDFTFRTRTILTFDSRAPTDWGTVRAYFNLGWTWDSHGGGPGGAKSFYVNRAFIQWAGFTFGTAQSFYDELVVASYTYWALYTADTGATGTNLAAYTTQWGNGISTTIAAEDPRRHQVVNVPGGDFPFGPLSIQQVGSVTGCPPGGSDGVFSCDYKNVTVPDIVSNIRIDQAWGNWQVMSALHQVGAAYYRWPCNLDGTTVTNSMECGYPNDKFGWAIGTGANINVPWITKGDRFGFQFNYAKGAVRYTNNQPGPFAPGVFGGNYSLGLGMWADAVYRDTNVPVVVNGQLVNQAGSLELTDSWSFMGVYEHKWTPNLKTSFYGGDVEVSYNANATSYLCQNVFNAPSPGGIGFLNQPANAPGTLNTACDPDYGIWFVGSRTQWNIRPDFYMGVDIVYQKLQTSFAGLASYAALPNTPRPSSGPLYKIEDQDELALTFRVHRDILP
jgi:Porin subfamily